MEVIFDGLKKFVGEITFAILLTVIWRTFPRLMSFLTNLTKHRPKRKNIYAYRYRKIIFFITLLAVVTFAISDSRLLFTNCITIFKSIFETKDLQKQYELGLKYYETKHYEQAIYWYLKAAEQEHPGAQINLGYMYQHGLGVKQDYTEAVKWYRVATQPCRNTRYSSTTRLSWYALAANNLGYMYLNGYGVEQNYSKAVELLRSSIAMKELTITQNNLGMIYENGYGVQQNYEKAIYWYRKAAKKGNKNAEIKVKEIQELMGKK